MTQFVITVGYIVTFFWGLVLGQWWLKEDADDEGESIHEDDDEYQSSHEDDEDDEGVYELSSDDEDYFDEEDWERFLAWKKNN